VTTALPEQRALRLHGAIAPLFVATTFTASALLFVVQPLFAKMVLPQLGGSPAVWNTCVLFFQAVLLLAYLYAHLTVRWLGARAQALSHLLLLLLPLAVLPVHVAEGGPPADSSPVWWLLRMMALRIGLPFFAVATMAPLVQRWFATLPLRSAADPYFLYAASNAGSLLALLAFPFLLEPAYGVRSQASGWVGGYVLLVALAAACAVVVWRYGGTPASASPAPAGVAIGARQRAWWVLLAFVPSSLMLGVTTHISTDIAAVPLLWIVPLCLYLTTFVLAFSTHRWTGNAFFARAFPLLALASIASILLQIAAPSFILLHLAAFFACAMVCHRQLAAARPPPVHLTEFYFWLSLGGVLGGAFNTLVAPQIFDGVYEYPLVLALGSLLRPAAGSGKPLEPWLLFAVSGATVTAICVGLWTFGAPPPHFGLRIAVVTGVMTVGAFWAFARRRAPFNAVMLGGALLVLGGFGGLTGSVMFSDRSFFGMLKVIDGPHPGFHVMLHGTTLHGQQDVRIAAACNPLAYFHRNGPVGQLFSRSEGRFQRIAVVGLGTGALACYAGPGQRMTFFEIDPMVERVARDPRLFSYLQNTRGETTIVIGDGRKMLEGVPPGSYDLIMADAFSSDSVPVHLMTREALQLYASRLRPGGIVAIHISNRYLQLEPVVAATAAAAGLSAIVNNDAKIPNLAENAGRYPSHWVLAASDPTALEIMRGRPGWTALNVTGGASAWTDDYSNIVQALKLRRRR
jgi:SAM-dependent methyltransferase